jgi:hypothetical protein
MPKKHLWAKAKSSASAFAANMGVPMHRKAKKAPAGMKVTNPGKGKK